MCRETGPWHSRTHSPGPGDTSIPLLSRRESGLPQPPSGAGHRDGKAQQRLSSFCKERLLGQLGQSCLLSPQEHVTRKTVHVQFRGFGVSREPLGTAVVTGQDACPYSSDTSEEGSSSSRLVRAGLRRLAPALPAR